MTSALPLALPQRLRHPSWHALVLLPVLPLLARWIGMLQEQTTWSNYSQSSHFYTGPMLLGLLGLALAFTVPDTLDRLSHRVRKEAELLRVPWLVSVFLLQAATYLVGGGSGLDPLLFVGTCALLAAIPLGSEFQQRTLAGLLAQPVSRADWWSLKMRAPALAIGVHWVLYLATRLDSGESTSPVFALATLCLAAVVWAATPWWTLIARGLLAGLVFSLTLPLVSLFVLSLTVEAIAAAGSYRIAGWGADDLAMAVLLGLGGPAYAIAAYRLARIRWLRLEAPDTHAGDAGILGLPLLRGERSAVARRTPILSQLVRKELRLQVPTFLMGVAAMVAGLISTLPLGFLNNGVFYLQGGFFMLATATLLLAAATTVAEERRLGTLDAQLLQPSSRELQWWIKVAVAALPALVMAVLIRSAFPPLALGQEGIAAPIYGSIALAGAFAIALLVSTVASNSLRALITGAALAATLLWLGFATHWIGVAWLNSVREHQENGYMLRMEDIEALRPLLASVSEFALRSNLQRSEDLHDTFPSLTRPLFLLPVLLALLLARRNFLNPGAHPRRLARQVLLILACLVALIGVRTGVYAQLGLMRHDAARRYGAVRHFEWEARLSPAERQLYQHYFNRTYALDRSVAIPSRLAPGEISRGPLPRYVLPLNPDSRQRLLQRGNLPEPIRELLELEGARDPRPVTPPPQAPPQAPPPAPEPGANFQMSRELMQRYGLIPPPPRGEAPAQPSAPAAPSTPPPAAAAPPATFQMSPELMRRYGLQPPAPVPQDSSTNPVAPTTPPAPTP